MKGQQILPFVEVQDEITDAEILRRCRSVNDSIRLCVNYSGMCVKEVAHALDMDPNQLTRMISDNPNDRRHFPPDQINQLQEICGNLIVLRYLALSNGFGLHKLKSRLEEENEVLKRQLEEQQLKLATITDFMRSVKGAA